MEECYFQRDKLIELREEKKLTQTELAYIINTHQYIISRLESGTTKDPRTYTLWKISKFFKVPMESFLGQLKINKD